MTVECLMRSKQIKICNNKWRHGEERLLVVHRRQLGEVHDLLGDGVHGDGARHGAGRAVLAAGGLVAALARVVLLLHQVVARAEGHQVRVVGGRGDGHGARAAHVRVAQLVRQALQLVRPEVVVVPQHVVVRRPRRALRHAVPSLTTAVALQTRCRSYPRL